MSDYITQDLLFLILKWLPVKTLLRCRCVSKSWNQLIASKSFILDHLSVQTPSTILQNHDLRYHLFVVPVPHTSLPSFRTLKGPNCKIKRGKRSHNGFTFSSVNGVNCIYNNANTLVLFNPSTRQLLNIPLPKLPIFRSNSNAPFKYCGFWIDPSNKDFKLVIFCLETCNAVLFSSDVNVWIEVDVDHIRGCRSTSQSPQVTIDGVAHWYAYTEDNQGPGIVISFNFEQRKFETIDMPPINLSTGCLRLCKWQDFLSVMHCGCILYGDSLCNLWVMQNGLWSKMFSFDLPGDTMSVYCVLGSSGRVLAQTLSDSLMLYDPKDGVITPLKTTSGIFCYSFSYDFVESFVFPDPNCISCD